VTTVQAAIGLAVSCAAAVLAAFASGPCMVFALMVASHQKLHLPTSADYLMVTAGVFAALGTLIAAVPACLLLLLVSRPSLRLLRGSALRYVMFGTGLGICSLLALRVAGLPDDMVRLGMPTALVSSLVGSLTFWWYARRLGNIR
jgi:hypothetical protein